MTSRGNLPRRKKSKEKADLNRSCDVRQSKTKRVKNYLKKCKNALGRSATLEVSSGVEESTSATSSWYLENGIEDNLNECEINELDEVFEDAQVSLNLGDCDALFQVANIIEVKGPSVDSSDSDKASDGNDSKGSRDSKESTDETPKAEPSSSEPETASPNLKNLQEEEVGNVDGDSVKVQEEVETEITLKLITNY
ncbi:hypothetical protein NQ318_016807 [Aromia moschata]|uniref:Uncharacterized protein n=1 Tax=Aromia moschata TaxID=1265417 RepID=A0AAV8YTS4_9CUCU|nr:hypothetical protein NQ318_016807 [Aromia moschata]